MEDPGTFRPVNYITCIASQASELLASEDQAIASLLAGDTSEFRKLAESGGVILLTPASPKSNLCSVLSLRYSHSKGLPGLL